MENNESIANWKDRFFQSMKEQALTHLRGISNQKTSVPIPGVINDLSVGDLILELEKETLIGVKYMIEWSETLALIQLLKNEKEKNESYIPSDPDGMMTC
jgi:hypothetical protein